MNLLLRIFMTFSSVSLFIVVYLVHNKIEFFDKLPYFEFVPCQYRWVGYFMYLLAPLVITAISLLLALCLSSSEVNGVKSIEPSNNDFLSNYLAFFFVALSIKDNIITFWVVFLMTLVFTFYSRVSFFNPVFLIFGFNFYYVYTDEDVKIMIISKKKLRSPKNFEKMICRRINDYTFLEI